jgi:DNA gyrase/topoisomerase IV subunit B
MKKVSNDIKTLEFPENIRTRPVMYMNDIVHSDHALTETVDNAADHVFRDSSVTKIEIKTASKAGEFFFVANDGSSFPIAFDETYGRTKMHLAVDQMHSGSNFEGGDTSVGQNGVGLKGCNALSSKFCVITLLNDENVKTSSAFVKSKYSEAEKGSYFAILYNEGKLVQERVSSLKDICENFGFDIPEGYTTYIVSYPDPKIYENPVASLDSKRIGTSILIFDKFYKRKIQYILNGKKIKSDESGYKYSTLVDYKVPGLTTDGARDDNNTVQMQLLLNYEFDKDLEVMASGGNINTRNVPRGHHINIGRERLAQALKKVFDIPHNHLQKGMKLDALLLAPGAHLQLAGQTKDSLIRIKCFTEKNWDTMEKALIKDLTKVKDELSLHVFKLNEYAMTLDKLAAKDYVKSMISVAKNSNPIISRKVRDASSKNRDECTLYIVEGKSAAGSLLEARDPRVDAVFAMRGFALNTVGKTLEQVFQNEEFCDLISAIGLNEPHDEVIYHEHFFNCWKLLRALDAKV